MLPFKVIECKDYDAIKEELLSYINEFTDLLTKNPFAENYDKTNPVKYPNFVNSIHFAKRNPKTIAWLKSLKLIMRDVYFTLSWYNKPHDLTISPCKIHLDKPPVQWKMNFPILNMEPTSIRFFKLKDQSLDINNVLTRYGDPESKDNDNYVLSYEFFELDVVHKFDKNQPIIMNGQIPHDVGVHGEVKYPRIGIQLMFTQEPLHLINN